MSQHKLVSIHVCNYCSEQLCVFSQSRRRSELLCLHVAMRWESICWDSQVKM